MSNPAAEQDYAAEERVRGEAVAMYRMLYAIAHDPESGVNDEVLANILKLLARVEGKQ